MVQGMLLNGESFTNYYRIRPWSRGGRWWIDCVFAPAEIFLHRGTRRREDMG
jgi:hypothetical protein